MADPTSPVNETLSLTSTIVSAYAGRNQMSQGELPELIRSAHAALNGISGNAPQADEIEAAKPTGPLVPAVPIDQSVTEDAIICLGDGKSFNTLKRHLRTAFDMSPQDHREKWGLSKDDPMVAPFYSACRSETAKKIGLGKNAAPKRKTRAKAK
ncbi:MucR family transcriptional regulator [Shimia sp. R9_3]|uniref:MucR family transcriptional regulator n=1 Tax=Shimia sp. R9_3 TaxID=2821113 RepID=UPI001ADC38BC|nr:MucR family transcriptional regulator [Shimia sp. R9_3]MBO9403331.1 MucR family transcriptional regulator [Shimia sp. R9_3]